MEMTPNVKGQSGIRMQIVHVDICEHKGIVGQSSVGFVEVIDVFAPVVEDHEVSSVPKTIIGLGVEFFGSFDVLEVPHHQNHAHHAEHTRQQTLQENLKEKNCCIIISE